MNVLVTIICVLMFILGLSFVSTASQDRKDGSDTETTSIMRVTGFIIMALTTLLLILVLLL